MVRGTWQISYTGNVMQKTTNNKTVSLHRLVFLQQGQISELVGHAGFVIELVKLTLQAARWAPLRHCTLG